MAIFTFDALIGLLTYLLILNTFLSASKFCLLLIFVMPPLQSSGPPEALFSTCLFVHMCMPGSDILQLACCQLLFSLMQYLLVEFLSFVAVFHMCYPSFTSLALQVHVLFVGP